MPPVRLIHPIPVTLEVLNGGSTRYDPDTKEPIPGASRTVKKLKAQVKYFSEKELAIPETGPQLGSTGYLLFLQADLTKIGLTVQQGDKITKIGKRDAQYYITGTMPRGHYPDHCGHTLLQANFTDRRPTQ